LKTALKIILASSSSRRRELLEQLGIKSFQVVKHKLEEELIPNSMIISKIPTYLAYLKAKSIRGNNKHKKSLIISADTIVYRCGKIFDKTQNEEKIKSYLEELSGRKHKVYGGICVISPSGEILKRLVITDVYFKKIPKNELNNPIFLKDGKGKAGGYAIQGYGGRFVRKIRGSYTNVVGLSIVELNEIFDGIGLSN
jgi:septum formation protein